MNRLLKRAEEKKGLTGSINKVSHLMKRKKVLVSIPEPARSSSATKRNMRFPYRLCLAGGWIDQPWVSEIHPGSAVVAQIFMKV